MVRVTSPSGGPCAEAAIGWGWAAERAHTTRTPKTAAAAMTSTRTPSTARRRGLARTPRRAIGTVRIRGFGGAGRRWRPTSRTLWPEAIDPGVTGPGVTGPGVTGPGVTGPGVTGPGVTGPGVDGPGAKAAEEDETETAGRSATVSRLGTQPANFGATAAAAAGAAAAADGIPRIEASRSASGGSGRRRGIGAH